MIDLKNIKLGDKLRVHSKRLLECGVNDIVTVVNHVDDFRWIDKGQVELTVLQTHGNYYDFTLIEEVLEEQTTDVPERELTVLEHQEGGQHYKGCKIQPVEYVHANNLGYLEGNVIKYVTRHKEKNGIEDIKKAIHYLQIILELDYKDA